MNMSEPPSTNDELMDELIRELATLYVEDPERNTPEFWSDLGNKLFGEFKEENCGHQCCIDNTIAAYAKAVELSSGKEPKHVTYLHDLAYALYYRYLKFRIPQDIDRAIHLYKKIIDLYPDDNSYLERLSTVQLFQETRFEQTRAKDDIIETIGTSKKAVDFLLEGDPRLPGYLNDLADNFGSLFDLSNNINDVEEAIILLRKALDLAPDHPMYLSNLGLQLRTRFENAGDIGYIEEAIALQRKAIQATDADEDPVLYNKLNNLAMHLATRYSHLGDIKDLEESIEIQECSIELLTDDHPAMLSMLFNLGTKFRSKYLHTGELQDIQKSVYLLQKSISLSHPGSSALPTLMSDLGNALGTRFDHTGDMNDLNEAIEMQKKALGLLPLGHADVGRMLTNLGGRLVCRFNNTNATYDLEEAIDVNRAAISHTPETHPFITGRLTNLTSALENLYLVTGDPSAIEEAVEVQKRAIQLTSDGHPGMPNYLGFLAGFLKSHFKHTGNISDLLEARELLEKAVEITPDDHPLTPSLLNSLGSMLEMTYKHTDDPETLDNAGAYYQHAAIMGSGKQAVCLQAARNWARIAELREAAEDMMAAYTCAFEVLPHIAWLGYTIAHRHSQLRMISQLANEACAAALSLGEVGKAVEWLEEGRGIVWSQLNQLRTPLDKLESVAPDLAQRLAQVSTKLEHAGSASRNGIPATDMSGKLMLQEEAQNQQELAREREVLLEEIRTLPGFNGFLKPLQISQMIARIPEDGHVVLINVHPSRCDAIVLQKNVDMPIHIALPDLSFAQGLELQIYLQEDLASEGVRSREVERSGRIARFPPQQHSKKIQEILSILWNSVTKPILEEIGISHTGSQTPSRIWWCPTGPLAFLPLHAAGLYGKSRKPGSALSDYVISSYTPTISALVEKVNQKKARNDFQGILTISVPEAPELPIIPNTTKECQWISDGFSENGLKVRSFDQQDATVANVLEAMDAYNWIHMACHASQNLQEPTKSAFYLQDGELELMDIMRKNLPNAELAFLSACQTSAGTETLSEEAVHLAAGMLMAGYRSVIATLWSIDDQIALMISKKVYSYLLQRVDGAIPASERAAEALHYATLELQGQLDDSDRSLLSWIPFIHMGL